MKGFILLFVPPKLSATKPILYTLRIRLTQAVVKLGLGFAIKSFNIFRSYPFILLLLVWSGTG